MAWINIIGEQDADGLLGRIYETIRKRAGRVANILKVQSRSPQSLKACIELYTASTLAESPLSRAQREMLATVVSRVNDCHY